MSKFPFKTHFACGHEKIEENIRIVVGKRWDIRKCTKCPKKLPKTHCKWGHELIGENIFFTTRPSGRIERCCRICSRKKGNKYRALTGRTINPGIGKGGAQRALTHCPYGHDYSINTRRYGNGAARYCNTCDQNAHIRSKYGITLDDKLIMEQVQSEKCAICGIHKSQVKKGLAIDHDHVTGELRSLLCGPCNGGLGNFKDNVEFLKSAISYLYLHNLAQSVRIKV